MFDEKKMGSNMDSINTKMYDFKFLTFVSDSLPIKEYNIHLIGTAR